MTTFSPIQIPDTGIVERLPVAYRAPGNEHFRQPKRFAHYPILRQAIMIVPLTDHPLARMTLSVPCETIRTNPEFQSLASMANLLVDLRYASPENFMRRDMYSPLDCAWVHRDAAAGLTRAVEWLGHQRPEVRLCVLDALRPQRVQEAMWAALEGTPLTQYLAPPKTGSIHSFGMAIDATLIDANGDELDMGTSFDDMTELSHPTLEVAFLRAGALDERQVGNRHLLREAMRRGDFRGIGTEWWHFDCGDRAHVRATYARVM